MAQQIKKKFIADDAIDGSKLKLLEGEAVRLQTPAGEVELLKKDAQGKLVSEGEEISFKDDMEAHVESVRSSLQSNIDAEESARIADVDAEESRAMSVESSLQSQITQEISDRQADVDAEQSRAEGVEASLQSQITQEISDRIADVNEEQSRAEGVESSLQSQITQEVSDRQSEVTRVEGLLSTEESARIAGDQSLQSQIDNVLSNIDPTALDSLTEIIAAFQEADGSLQGAISTLAGNSSGNIEAEQSRAMAVEASLQAQINQEISDRQADVDSEESRAMGVESSLQSQLSQEISDRIADVNAEESARIAEDLTLVKLNGSRSMMGNLSMGGGAPVLQTQTKNVLSGVTGTRQTILTAQSNTFGTQSGGDYDGQDYVDFTLTQAQYDSLQIGTFIMVSDPADVAVGYVQSSVVHKEVLDAENNSFRFYIGGGVYSTFSSPVEVLIEFKTAPKVSISFPGLLNNGFDATQENFKLELITSGNFFSGVYTKVTLANFVGGIGGGSWTSIDPTYISGTPTVNSAGLVEYFEADSLTNAFGLQRLYVFTEKVLVASSFRITNLSSGISPTDAANYGQVLSVSSLASSIQNELNTTQSGAGLSASGTYTADITRNFSQNATSLHNADKFLDDAIKSEESRAMGVEGSLQSQITQEISDRQADVDAEESRAMGVESSLQSELDATQLGAGLASDGSYVPESQFTAFNMSGVHYIMNATSLHDADKLLDANLKNTYDTLNGLIINEFQFRLDGDAAEASARAVAVQSLQSAISSEESSRIAADQSLQSQIDNVLSNLDPAALDSLTEIVAAFQSADSSLQGAISTLAGNSSGNIEAEESRAMAVEASLQSQITQEISDRQADVDAEESRALAVEGSLQSQISQEISDRMAAVSAEESARIAEDLTFFKKDGSREMTGSIIPSIDVSFDLGSSSKRFRDLYLSGSTIDLGGVTLSNESNEFVVRDSSNSQLAIVSDNVREGMVNKFFTESRVQETEMSMFDVTKSGEVVSTDSLVDAVSKLQNQMTQEISDRQDDVDTEESRALAAEGLLDGRLDVLEALAFEKESFTLGVNPTGVTLAHSPKAKSTVMFVGRLALHEGLDYSISGNQVTFIGDFAYNSEDEIAAAEGDVVKVTYYY